MQTLPLKIMKSLRLTRTHTQTHTHTPISLLTKIQQRYITHNGLALSLAHAKSTHVVRTRSTSPTHVTLPISAVSINPGHGSMCFVHLYLLVLVMRCALYD